MDAKYHISLSKGEEMSSSRGKDATSPEFLKLQSNYNKLVGQPAQLKDKHNALCAKYEPTTELIWCPAGWPQAIYNDPPPQGDNDVPMSDSMSSSYTIKAAAPAKPWHSISINTGLEVKTRAGLDNPAPHIKRPLPADIRSVRPKQSCVDH
jgi:hypothetical protein